GDAPLPARRAGATPLGCVCRPCGRHQGRLDRRPGPARVDRAAARAGCALMEVATGRVVTVEYTVRLASGELVDSTGGCGPIALLYGAGQLFPALEERIAGMRPGETRELRIPADEAYGRWRPELVGTLPRDRIPPELELTVGSDYRVKAPDGRSLRFRVLE